MGRKLKYKTESERIIARNICRMKYYWKNAEIEKAQALDRYYKTRKHLKK